jgi:hypothetical protein
MPVADNYQIIQVTSSDANIRVDVTWDYDQLSELYIWQQDIATGVVSYFNLGDFTVVEKTDLSGDYIEVQNVSTGTAIVNTGRATPKAQTYNLANSEAIDPVALIEALDQAVKMIQESAEIVGTPDRRVITSVNPFDVPDKVTRAGKLLSFDENGDVQFTTSDEALDTAIGYAEEWANNPEDQLVSLGAGGDQIDDYSALHHSAKASAQRVLAETARTGAETAETNAQTAQTNAETAQTNAETAETNAQTAETNASTSESNALASENKAQLWAEEAEDVEVEPGLYSAKHWAQKAEELSSGGGGDGGTLLTTIDMTNGGANDLNNIDITWQASWDTYDYVKIFVDGANATNTGQFGFVLSGNAGSTWKTLFSTTRQACSPTSNAINAGDSFGFVAEMALRERVKPMHFWNWHWSPNSGGGTLDINNNIPYIGTLYSYSGTTLTNTLNTGDSVGWDTGGDGFFGYLLRFTHEVGNFNSGTLKIIGYNYPS